MSIRSVKHSNERKNKSRSPLSQNPSKQYNQQYPHSLANMYSPKSSGKSNYLQQQYLTLKDKLKTVEHQNAVILKKIKSNMVAVYQSEEDTFCHQKDVNTMKLTLPIALQRTHFSDDNEADSVVFSNSYMTSNFQAQSQQSFLLPVIQKAHRSLDYFSKNVKESITFQIENYNFKVQSRMATVNTKVKALEFKFYDLLSVVESLKNIHFSNKLNLKVNEEMSIHKIRQNQILLQDCMGKIRKLTAQNEILQEKMAKKQQEIEGKNQSIDQLQRKYQALSSKYNEILGQSSLQKMILSNKMIQITHDKNTVIESLQRKLENLTMSVSMHAINSNSNASPHDSKFKNQIEKLKEQLSDKSSELENLKNDYAKLCQQKQSLSNYSEEKSQELSKVSYQLKESQLITKKAHEMFEELQKQYKEVQIKRFSKESEYTENIRKLKEKSKKKITQLHGSIFEISQIIGEIMQKMPKKMKKQYDFDVQGNPSEALKVLNKIIMHYQQKQNKLAREISQKLNVSMIQIQINGVDSVIQKIRRQLQQKNRKIAELDQAMHQMNIQKIRSKKDLSPINSSRKFLNLPSPKSQSSAFFIEQQLNEKKKEVSQLKGEILKKDNEIQFHKKKLALLSQQKDQLNNRFDIQKLQLKKIAQQKQSALIQKELLQREQRQDLNKSSSAKAFLEVKFQKLSEKNSELSKQNDKLQRKVQVLQGAVKNNQNNLQKAREDFKSLEKNLRQEIAERKMMISTLNEERSKLKMQIVVLNAKIEARNLQQQKQIAKKQKQEKKECFDREVGQLKKHLEQKERLIKNFEHKNRLIQKRKQQAQNDLKTSHSINKLLESKKSVQTDEMKREIARLKTQKEQACSKNGRQIQKLQKKNSVLQEEKKQLQKLNSTLQKQIKQVKNKLKGQRQKLLQKNQQLQHCNGQIKILQGKLNQANMMSNQLIKINKNLQDEGNNERDQIANKNKTLERELSTLKGQLKKQEMKVSELKCLNSNKEQQLNQVRLNYELLKNSVKQQAKQKSLIRDKVQENQKMLRESLNTLQHEKLALEIKLSNAQSKIQRLSSQLAVKSSETGKMKVLLDQKQHEILLMIQKNNDLKYSLMDDLDNKSEYIRQIRTEYTGQLEFLQEKISFAQKQNLNLKGENQKIKDKYEELLRNYNESTIKLRNIQNALNGSKEELNQKNREVLQFLRKLEENQEQIIRLNNECSLLKGRNDELLREIKQDRQNNVEFIKDLDVQHRQETELLTKKIRKHENVLKEIQSKLLLSDGALKQRELDCQILESKILTEKKWRQDLLRDLEKKNVQIEQLKAKAVESDQSKSNNHISVQKQHQKSNNHLVHADYISILRKQVAQIVGKQKFDFSSHFISLHDSEALYQLSLFKNDLINKNIQHSFLQELQFADTNGFEFVSQIEDELDDVVARLQNNHQGNKSNHEQIESLKATVKTYEAKVQQLRDIREKKDLEFQGMNDFYLREIKSMREQNNKMADAMVNLEKLIERILAATVDQEPKILQLKQSFEKMDDIYQEVRGGSIINFDKYRQAYLNKAKQFQRSKSKKKGWF